MTLSLAATRDISGFIRANLINSHYGMGLVSEHADDDFPDPDMETAAMADTFAAGGDRWGDAMPNEDFVVAIEDYYHVMRALDGVPELFMHVVLDRKSTDLDAARQRLAHITRDVSTEFAV
jgi:hypothetical protein